MTGYTRGLADPRTGAELTAAEPDPKGKGEAKNWRPLGLEKDMLQCGVPELCDSSASPLPHGARAHAPSSGSRKDKKDTREAQAHSREATAQPNVAETDRSHAPPAPHVRGILSSSVNPDHEHPGSHGLSLQVSVIFKFKNTKCRNRKAILDGLPPTKTARNVRAVVESEGI